MTRNRPTDATPFEPRWPVAITVLAVLALQTVLPESVRLLPVWVVFVIGTAVLVPIAAVGLTAAKPRWRHIEHAVTVFFSVYSVLAILANLAHVVDAMVTRSAEVSGLQLIASSIALWANTILMFSLLYWQLDRGGPEARIAKSGGRPDWLFPQEGAPAEDVPESWRPVFVDYLFLGYMTATAFSPTDTLPLTSRAKLLMMLESAISLGTILIVAARAINILG